MNRNRVEHALWCSAVVIAVVTTLRLKDAAPPPALRPGLLGVRAVGERSSAASGELAQTVIDSNPFRLDRRPALVRFSASSRSATPTPEPPRIVRPNLALIGTLGPPWRALLSGVPDHAGNLIVQQGDSVAGLLIAGITRDTVVVRGFDTTWTLTVRLSWR